MAAYITLALASTGCSTIVVGRLASESGAVFVSHSNDGAEGDWSSTGSVHRVPPADWPAGATRLVHGHAIPQVAHTYGYLSEGYAAMKYVSGNRIHTA